MTCTILLAAGGTGGHIFPAQALAEILLARGHRPVLVTDRRFKNYVRQHGGIFSDIDVRTIRSGSPSGSFIAKIQAFVALTIGTVQSLRHLLRLRPKAVVGFGGYPSFPVMAAAFLLRIPTVIHEQNAVLGRANAALVPFVRRIATSYLETERIDPKHRSKTVFTGNPVRQDIMALRDMPYPALEEEDTLHLLVTGGSQGAAVFSEVVPEAIRRLPELLRRRLRIAQQCRPVEMEVVRTAYEDMGVDADLMPFFDDMADRLAAAHLVICRAGASTVAELLAAGRPGVLVPFPHAMDNHQMKNAAAVEDAGCGWVIPQEAFTPEVIAARLEAFLNLPSRLQQVAEKTHTLNTGHAAGQLAEVALSLGASPPSHPPSKRVNPLHSPHSTQGGSELKN